MKAISTGSREFQGYIPDEETYEAYRDGKRDWRVGVRSKIKIVRVPIEIFDRLVELDRKRTVSAETDKNGGMKKQ